MEHVLFFPFSFFEFAAGLAFVLALFRLDFVEYRTHIMYTAFLLTEISYLLRMGFDLEPISLVFQMASLIVMFVLLYQLPLFTAIIIGTVGYIMYGLLQLLIMVFSTVVSPLTLGHIYDDPHYILGYIFQASTSAIGFIIAWLIRRYRFGFNFLPKKRKLQFDFDIDNILIFSIMAIAVLTIMTYSIFMFDQLTTTIVLMSLLLIQIALLIHLAIRKVNRSD